MEAIVYCLLIETVDGLLLVDTGFGTADYEDPSLLMRAFMAWMDVPGRMEETAVHQVEALGYSAGDVRHIVLTHLHLDHAGGLRDFPAAQVHVHRAEVEAINDPRGLMARFYDARQWSHGPDWVLHDRADSDWYGFPSIGVAQDLPLDVRLIPLPGHSCGHCGVAVAVKDGWLLHCGDAASPFHPRSDLHGLDRSAYAMAWLPGWLARRALGPHVDGLRALLRRHSKEVEVISSHDLHSFRRCRHAVSSLDPAGDRLRL